jgi:hypothetical protein
MAQCEAVPLHSSQSRSDEGLLDHAGFPEQWREWIEFMLKTASTKVITNGRPGPVFAMLVAFITAIPSHHCYS